ncbi:MAG: hypothetical protein BroJett013_23210 [Alphaproteobacteria bacterium]|nr:MAG: hypothetical protein BroJett013_23210 [Alphaproteobacteria bacterium]
MKRIVVAAGLLALAACERADETPPDLLAECRTLADRAARIDACTRVIDDAARDGAARAAALNSRAAARLDGGEVTAALRDYETALRLDENDAEALVGRAGILVQSGQLDAAEPLLERAREGERAARANALLGQIALSRGQFEQAVGAFDATLRLDPGMAAAMAGRARAKQHSGDLDGAAADFDAAVRLDGALADARAGRCWLDLRAGRNLDRARTDAEAAVAASPHNVEAQLCRGVLQLRGGEWANARASFERVLEVEPGNPAALFGRGVARRRSGEDAGREDMNLARDFDRHIGETYRDLGVQSY